MARSKQTPIDVREPPGPQSAPVPPPVTAMERINAARAAGTLHTKIEDILDIMGGLGINLDCLTKGQIEILMATNDAVAKASTGSCNFAIQQQAAVAPTNFVASAQAPGAPPAQKIPKPAKGLNHEVLARHAAQCLRNELQSTRLGKEMNLTDGL